MCNEAIILAGGAGTRLKDVVRNTPKPMALIHGKPFLEYLLAYLSKNGITRVILSVGFLSDQIETHFGNRFGDITICYAVEWEALGTGGGVKLALQHSKTEHVFILNGDTLFNVDLQKIIAFHQKHKADLTIALHEVDDGSRYGNIRIDDRNKIVQFEEKKQKPGSSYINGGTYLLSKRSFLALDFPQKFSFEKDFLEKYFLAKQFYGLAFTSYFIDIGIPETYKKAQSDFLNF